MKIDVSERINEAKSITAAWAEKAGYQKPEPETLEAISGRARDVRRVLSVSNFGCQERQVHALCEALLGEKIPEPKRRTMAEYLERVPFAIGSVLVPVVDGTSDRPGVVSRVVSRVASTGNAGLKMSNGCVSDRYSSQRNVRPATDEEIETYFAEFFGLAANPLDVAAAEAAEPELEVSPF